MKMAIVFEDCRTQIVLTPSGSEEMGMLAYLKDGMTPRIERASFYAESERFALTSWGSPFDDSYKSVVLVFDRREQEEKLKKEVKKEGAD